MARLSTATDETRPELSDSSPMHDAGAFWRMQAVFGKLRSGATPPSPTNDVRRAPAPARRPSVPPGTRPAWLGPPKGDEGAACDARTVVTHAGVTHAGVTRTCDTHAGGARRNSGGIDHVADSSCYEVLGVDPHASEDELRRRFRELAKRLHPDRGGRVDEFVVINRAYVDALRLLLGR